jgi:5'-3' exonuclease
MGVDGLPKWLRKNFPNVFKSVHISHFAFKKIPFDISSYIHKYIARYGKDDNKWLNAFIFLILLFRENAVSFIPIFDGKAPPEKTEEKEDRRNQKNNGNEKVFNLRLDFTRYKETGEISNILEKTMKTLAIKKYNEENKIRSCRLLPSNKSTNIDPKEESFVYEIDDDTIEEYIANRESNIFDITPEDINILKELLTTFKIPFLQAEDEAEALANYLVIEKLAYATFSLDSDCIAYKTPIVITDIDTSTGICSVIYFDQLCEELELEPDQVTLLCILSGVDYNRWTKLKGIGPVTAYKMIKKHNTFEDIKKNEKLFKNNLDGLRYNRCLELFSLKYPEIKSLEYWDLNISIESIELFTNKYGLKVNKDKINKLWSPPKLIFIN